MAAAEAAAVVPEKEPMPTACKRSRNFDTKDGTTIIIPHIYVAEK